MKHNNKGLSNFVNTWTPRVLSLLVAVFVFAGVKYFNLADRVVRIPLEVTLPETGVEPESLVPTSVDIILTGDDDLIYLIDPGSITASADFSDVTEPGISRRAVQLDYPAGVFEDTALVVTASPDVTRILFREADA